MARGAQKKCNDAFVISTFFATLRAVSDPLDTQKRLLSALDLGPSWARDAVPRPAHRPAKSATSASRLLVIWLNNVDFPTFGRPMSAITGFIQ